MSDVVLAIDPGSQKCGMALVRRRSEVTVELIWRAIVSPEEVVAKIDEALAMTPIKVLVIGSGTRSQPLVNLIRSQHPGMGILMVDERDTSLQARERYWEHHERRGWRRLLPSTLQVPPEPIDDFAALVIAERVLIP